MIRQQFMVFAVKGTKAAFQQISVRGTLGNAFRDDDTQSWRPLNTGFRRTLCRYKQKNAAVVAFSFLKYPVDFAGSRKARLPAEMHGSIRFGSGSKFLATLATACRNDLASTAGGHSRAESKFTSSFDF